MAKTYQYGTIPSIQDVGTATVSTSSSKGFQLETEIVTRKGHSCFGRCCDMRRAVIIVNTIMIGMLLVDILGIAMLGSEDVDDDGLKQMIAGIPTRRLIVIFVLEIVCCAVGIYGALRFSVTPLLLGFGLYAVTVIINLLVFNIVAILLGVLFAYPHIYLIHEIKSGIMARSTYPYEEQSCCCV